MNTRGAWLGLTAVVLIGAGCGGQASTNASSSGSNGSVTSGGPDNDPTSSGGASGGASGGSGGPQNTGPCGGFQAGATVSASIGGTALSLVAVQSTADIAGACGSQLADLVKACSAIAVGLNASSSDQAAAAAQALPRDKAKAWCQLAAYAIGTTKASTGGVVQVAFNPAPYKLSQSTKGTCQARCSTSGTCDVLANPLKCTGGTMSGAFCEGGRLEGGCAVDARCDSQCDVSVVASAQCSAPPVTVTTLGASNTTIAAQLKLALETNLPAVLQLEQQFALEANVAATVASVASSLADLTPACIPPVVKLASESVNDIQAGTAAAGTVRSVVQ